MSLAGTVAEAPPGYTINSINSEYRGNHLIISAVVMAALSGISLILRLYTRKFLVRGLGWDDWCIVCAWVFAFALCIGDCLETKYGMGYHIWDIKINDFNTYLKLQLFVGAAYICALAFAKLSICCFYLRLSPDREFQILVWLVIGITTAYSIAACIVPIFSCNPVAASWDVALMALPTTTCLNRPAQYLAQSIINIITEIFIFILPLNTIWKLQIPFRHKLSVSSLLALGLVVCIISMIRLKAIVVVINSPDISWTTNELLIWSTVEVHTTIICVCIATLKPFVTHFFPNLLGKSCDRTLSRKNTKHPARRMDGEGEAFGLQSYLGQDDVYQNIVRVPSRTARDSRRRDGYAESQESIIGILEHDSDSKVGVAV